ncbi:MAG TPA: uroporphyrinogen-III C-methyltransferase [Actinomycetota bacterium]|nr:uroporphyrinogen-III C-methyltransferase [Actinomycetota bacterium]
MSGIVYLVGAGPGDPGLITARGLELLRTCDVVLYDRLVPEELLDEARPDAERIFVGKRPGEMHSRQVVADALMVSRARDGARVVRLKGGDPFVFGRGGEEGKLLADAGVPFEVVPGVSSAVAVPAYAGIPVTHRGVAGSFAVVTAREEEGRLLPPQRWGELARGPDTLVLLMGVSSLPEVARKLIEGGRNRATPAAVVEWGTTSRQRTVVGTLDDIADVAASAAIRAPATTVVGDVVAERSVLNWFESRPLFGRRIVVTRPSGRAGALTGRLTALGANVVALPAIAIEDPESWDALDSGLGKLGEGGYDWVAFASAAGVERFFRRLLEQGRDARAFGSTKVAAVGDATAAALAARGIRADLVPERFTGAALAAALGDGPGEVLLPRVSDGPRDLVDEVERRGWRVDEVAAYRNVPGEVDHPGDFDAASFTSASTVRAFAAAIPTLPEGAKVVCIGPATAAAAEEAGYRVDAVADPHTLDGLAAAVVGILHR